MQRPFPTLPAEATRRKRPGWMALPVLALLSLSWPVAAQDVDCQSLRARIGSAPDDNGGVEQFEAALRQQEIELRRTQSYSEQIGCDTGVGFGADAAQCDAIETRIARIQANLGQLRGQVEDARSQGAPQRRALIEQYNSFCRLIDPTPAEAPPASPDPAPPSRVRGLCVRHCDGGYFPISDSIASEPETLEKFETLCKALCPGTEASLYTTAPSGDLSTATAPDGSAYSSLPAAFKFQKDYDATCSCKPPNQSWAEALAAAQALIQGDKSDVVVTQSLSDQMARPRATRIDPAKVGTTVAPKPAVRKAARKPRPAPGGDGTAEAAPPPANPGEDLTLQFRRAAPAF